MLPKNYNFEIQKIRRRIEAQKIKRVALQFPDGLLQFSAEISDLIPCESIILSDVVYGACCIDDKTAVELECELLIHFGHSCLIPVQKMKLPVLYVFVDIFFDISHCIDMLKKLQGNIAVMGTIQYNWIIKEIKKRCNIEVPQVKPLSPGEVLGCTAPRINKNKTNNQIDTIFFIADGRFHLESLMLSNPELKFYRYCPFNKKVYREYYEIEKTNEDRRLSLEIYKKSKNIGLIRSRLQENKRILENIKKYLDGKNIYLFYVDEIDNKLLDFDFIEVFVQVACPRLSIDWGSSFGKPILNSAEIICGEYKMDFYSNECSGDYKH